VIDYWRQLDILSPSEIHEKVSVIGVGGIGSPTVLALAKMGISRLAVYDGDTIDTHNLPNQIYRQDDLGKRKVDALAEAVAAYAAIDLDVFGQFEDQPLSGVVISAVDSMAARQAIWQRVRYKPAVRLYIEARMGAEVGRVHTVKPVDPDMVRWYETTLYSDENAVEEPCTARAIIYNVFMIASLISAQVKRYLKSQDLPKELIFDFATYSFLV
jgi:hypothetical protein